ncbi:Follicle cell protein 3C-1 [Frankliniella fusca]|uniref:Follicle cell protein 3C-1 n=1 Tax=Frankliniella fusca TaxID=407009 RepID=A0AAE1HSK4_9NEOP|nr:Follicle cell protein 3C-1 [Frankliniella fusca]
MDRVFIAAICISAFVSAECQSEIGQSTINSSLTSPKPIQTSTPISKSTLQKPTTTPAPTSPSSSPLPATRARPALAGVRPMQDRSNSSDPIPCTCGIFLSSQCKGREQPRGLPAMSHEFKRATPNTPYGVRQCTSACVDMIVKHLPNSGPILCSSIEKTIVREKAYLFIKNYRNKWLATRLSAGKEFCCKNGVAVRCPSPK